MSFESRRVWAIVGDRGSPRKVIPLNALTASEMRALRSNNELGFVMCRLKSGGATHGKVSTGSHTRVKIQTDCPPGSKLDGIFHTHPDGVPYPSALDIRSARQVGARQLCIASGKDLRCYTLGKARGRR